MDIHLKTQGTGLLLRSVRNNAFKSSAPEETVLQLPRCRSEMGGWVLWLHINSLTSTRQPGDSCSEVSLKCDILVALQRALASKAGMFACHTWCLPTLTPCGSWPTGSSEHQPRASPVRYIQLTTAPEERAGPCVKSRAWSPVLFRENKFDLLSLGQMCTAQKAAGMEFCLENHFVEIKPYSHR